MATERATGSDLRKLINLAKNSELNFAFCIGNKDDDVLLVDRRAKPDALEREAKKMSSGMKAVSGVLTFADQKVHLRCEKPLPNMAKRVKQYFKAEKLDFKVAILDASGKALPEEDEGTTGAAGDGQEPATATTAKPRAVDAADIEDTEPKQEQKVPVRPVPPELAQRLESLMMTANAAGPKAAALARNGGGLVTKQIEAGDFDKAARTLGQMEAKLGALLAEARQAPGGSESATPPPPDLKAARQSWNAARKSVSADLQSLIRGIAESTKAVAGFEQAGGAAKNLARHFQPFDNRLGTALAELDTTPPGPQRDKLEKATRRLLRDHAAAMETEFFKSVDASGFASTTIRSTVLGSLQEVSSALKG